MILLLLACAPAPDLVGDAAATVHDTVGSLVEVRWNQTDDAAVTVQYRVDDDWRERASGGAAGEHAETLVGLPYDNTVEWQLAWTQDGETRQTSPETISTDPLPAGIPAAVLEQSANWDPDVPYVLVSVAGTVLTDGNPVVVLDRQARVVWAYTLPFGTVSLHPRLSSDGARLLMDHGTFWAAGFDGGAASQVLGMTLDHQVHDTWDTPGLHHPFTQLPDGSLVWGAFQGRDETLDKIGPDGTHETLFDCGAYLAGLDVDTYCGSNTVYWDAQTDHFLYSLYTVDTVLEIDHATGQVVQTYGHLDGAWAFNPPESAFWWQHGPTILDDGNLLVSCQPDGQDDDDTLRIREYARDADTQTLTQVWSWGDDQPALGEAMGEAHRLPGGHTLHNYGSGSRLREVTPDGEVVWEVTWDAEFIGRSTPLEDLEALLP